jgi:protocatechuate 3,4-dioxygenase beta subunit
MTTPMRRRRILRATTGVVLASLGVPTLARVLGSGAAAPMPTPSFTEGPFYPPAFDPEPTKSLVTGPLVPQAVPMRLAGRVVDRDGRPVGAARIEIWQCDANRHYHHPNDRGTLDPGFAGHGWQPIATSGAYRFDTIRPVAYPGRTPHIHVRVKRDERPVLTSQIFLPDETAANDRDFLWRQLDAGRRDVALATLEREGDVAVARFDIVLP